jgi:DNA-binding CsgD family transcriptional regulator
VPTAPASPAPGLLEREPELAVLHERLGAARDGAGGLLLVEGAPGIGKTALLRVLRADAQALGVRVLSAVGGELERDFPFGLVRQLLEAPLRTVPAAERDALLSGAAALAGPVLGLGAEPAAPGADASFATLHGLYWLVSALAEDGPLVLLVDDAHWGDGPSLRFLDFLGRRAPELPVLVAVGARPGEPGAEQALLDRLAEAPDAVVVRPADLSPEGTGALVAGGLGAAVPDDVLAAAHETTAGNPLLLGELVRSLAADEAPPTAQTVRAAVPRGVARSVALRVTRLAPGARDAVRALAVLGDRAGATVLGAVTGLDEAGLAQALTALSAADLVEGVPPSFVHPLVRQAVAASLSPAERDALHRRAAGILRDRGAADDEVALHLLPAEPRGEPWAAAALRAAGRRALGDGAPELAVRLLRRAADEPPPEADRAATLLELGVAQTRASDPGALAHLDAAAQADDPLVAARAEQVRAGLLILTGRAHEAVPAFERALATLGGVQPDSARIEGELLHALLFDHDLLAERGRRLAGAGPDAPPPVLAHLGFDRVAAGAPAGEVVAIAERALAGGELLRVSGVERPTYWYLVEALLMSEAREPTRTAIEEATLAARASGSRLAAAYVALAQTEWEVQFGTLERAEDEARRCVELFAAGGWRAGLPAAQAALASALLERDARGDAEAALAAAPTDFPQLRDPALPTRGRLLLEQDRVGEAVEALRTARAQEEAIGWRVTPRGTTRTMLAVALAQAGERDEARAIAEEEVALARRREVPAAEAGALLARARTEAGPTALATLGEAVAAARRSGAALAQARALLAFGAAVRRAGRRTDAREPLREARELAHRVGATAVETAAADELVVAGGRPQRIALRGIDALTPAERRVAEHAARGLTNREIAETLFVTRKTVELHLGHAYGKLGIRSRAQLAGALGEPAAA